MGRKTKYLEGTLGILLANFSSGPMASADDSVVDRHRTYCTLIVVWKSGCLTYLSSGRRGLRP
jgi:hypothetical protein